MRWPFSRKLQESGGDEIREGNSGTHEVEAGTCASLEDIVEMTPYDFEWFVLSTLQEMGYRDLALTPHSGDLGIDIIGKNCRGKTTVVQCKRFLASSKGTSPMLMTFIGMAKVHHKVNTCLYVSTGGYTKDARDLASKHRIELIDGPALAAIHCEQARASGSRGRSRGIRRSRRVPDRANRA